MTFAFLVVVIAAASGIASEMALRSVAPDSASALALCVMAASMLLAAWRLGRKPEPAPIPKEAAGQSLAPV